MKISYMNRRRFDWVASAGVRTIPTGSPHMLVAFPILSGDGHDGTETYFLGWHICECELALLTAKTATFYALKTIVDDRPDKTAGKGRIRRVRVFEGTRVMSSKLIYVIPGSIIPGYDNKDD